MWNMSFLKFFLIFHLIILLGACEPKGSYNIKSDEMIADLNKEIISLESDFKTLVDELEKVEVVLVDKDIDTEIRKSIKKEILEGEEYKKQIDQILSYLKLQRKSRHKSLMDRKKSPHLTTDAKEEVEAYFLQKKIKPLQRPWLERYRTAIEL